MLSIIVVNNPKDWCFHVPDVKIISAKAYLTDPNYAEIRHARVYNLCKAYRYQSLGYYVSLLAEARGHRAIPSVTTIQDLKSQSILRGMSDEIDQLIQSSFAKIKSKQFKLSIYFGHNVAKQYDKLCQNLYNLFQAPLLEAIFVHNKKWVLQNVNPIPINEVPEHHKPYMIEFAKEYFGKKRIRALKKTTPIYDLAILTDPEEKMPPSDKTTIKHFIHAAETLGFRTKLITKDDFHRIPEFDALFIRERTAVNHYTYRFSRRAHTENLVVIDDPESILRCTNKVYLAELLTKARIPTPKTVIVHKDNIEKIPETLGFPCVLKEPDGSFSTGVVKVEDQSALDKAVEKYLNSSDLIIAQEFMPTDFDWRIAFIDKKPLFACKYYMAKDHWQIINNKKSVCGKVEAVPINKVPKKVLTVAHRATNLIGDGLYGVDIKQVGSKVLVIEINDNPDIYFHCEDSILKDELYFTIMRVFLHRIEMRKQKH